MSILCCSWNVGTMNNCSENLKTLIGNILIEKN